MQEPWRAEAGHWRADAGTLARHLVWVGLILAVAAYGAVIVRNVTETLQEIASRPQPGLVDPAVAAVRPAR